MQPPGSPWPFGTPFGNENAFSGCGQVVAVGGSSGSIVKGLLVNALLMLCAASVQVAAIAARFTSLCRRQPYATPA